MASSVDELLQASLKYDYVRFTWADLHGIPRTKTVAARNLPLFVEDGVVAYAGIANVGPRCESVIMERVEKLNHPNADSKPDPKSLHPIPWAGEGRYSVGEVLCETYWAHDGTHQDACSRYVARKQLSHLKKIGFELLAASELEFCIQDGKTKAPMFAGADAFSSLVTAEQEPLLFDMDQYLWKAGVDVRTIQAEYGPGQFEFALAPVKGMKSADDVFILKEAVKEICSQKGHIANFMAKPFRGASSSGAHFNHSIWTSKGQNVFYDPNSKDGYSQLARHWLAGLLQHAPAMSALCCPTVNCYRRLGQPWTPVIANWGTENRFATIRTKSYGEKSTYFENRIPSSACNPYLALAATVAAGLDGVMNKLECPRPNQEDAVKLPGTLREAIEALRADRAMIDALGQEFVEWFIAEKERIELEKLKDCDPTIEDDRHFAKEQELYEKLL